MSRGRASEASRRPQRTTLRTRAEPILPALLGEKHELGRAVPEERGSVQVDGGLREIRDGESVDQRE
ncbi:hypothetical protein C5C10_15005 [Rathayibacter sp. AY1A3]|nr:hypothetical protein C5C10_15005 [Rathayibacter sp. AY1A3]